LNVLFRYTERGVNDFMSLKVLTFTGVLVGLLSSQAGAVDCNLTTLGTQCTINGAIYQEGDFTSGSSGTGVFPAFVQVTGNDSTIHAYNTTVNNTLDVGGSDVHNHAILLADVPIVTVGGLQYREFLLDINEPRSETKAPITLAEVQIFTSGSPNQSTESFAAGEVDIDGTLVYHMDAGADSSVQLLFGWHPGSGESDMRLLVLSSLFTGGPYVYLYSQFTNADAGGFEEWALNAVTTTPAQVPEPSVLALMWLAVLALRRWRPSAERFARTE
jgi:hypothetical protein